MLAGCAGPTLSANPRRLPALRRLRLQRIENGLAVHAFMSGNGAKNAVQRADSQHLMGGNGDTVRRWLSSWPLRSRGIFIRARAFHRG